MKFSTSEPGILVSGGAHVALLAALLIGFSQASKFDDAPEPIPVEIVTSAQVDQIMAGEKTAKEVAPQPHRVDQVADTPQPSQAAAPAPAPPVQPAPPLPPVRTDPPVQPTEAAATPPPPVDAPLPQPRPTPPPQVEAKAPPVQADAPDAVAPTPPQRTHVDVKTAVEQPAPLPPTKVKIQPKVDAKQKTDLKLDEVAQLLAETSTAQPTARPKVTNPPPDPAEKFDPTSISRLLAKNEPPSVATGQTISPTASIGAADASAAKMSPSLSAELDGLMLDQYRQCWSYLGLSQTQYVPEIKVEYGEDGSLTAEPSLLNPPTDPDMRSIAESAMRAVRKCNPMRIPVQFAPYYQQWRARTLRFDPQDMAG